MTQHTDINHALENHSLPINLNIDEFNQYYKPSSLSEFVANLSIFMPLVNRVPSIVFFVKDIGARYVLANETLAKRCDLETVQSIIGKTCGDIFGSPLGKNYTDQDFRVLREGLTIYDNLELHSYISGDLGWCITHKIPIYNKNDEIIGMLGMSIDLQSDESNQPRTNERIYQVEKYIRSHFDQAINIEMLADIAQISVSQLDRTFKKLFHMTPSQFIQKIRFEYAVQLLRRDLSITEISALCGYADHSAFSRKFKQLTGVTPRQFKISVSSISSEFDET